MGKPVILMKYPFQKSLNHLDSLIDTEDYEIKFLSDTFFFEDAVLKDKVRDPTPMEVDELLPDLLDSISGGSEVFCFGSFLFKNIFPGVGKYSDNVGKLLKSKSGQLMKINYDPSALLKREKLTFPFKKNMTLKVVANKKELSRLLNVEQSLEAIQKTIDLYKEGTIDHCIFDIETTSLQFYNGEIIAYVIAHSEEEPGLVIPTVINNEIPEHKKFDKFFECSKEVVLGKDGEPSLNKKGEKSYTYTRLKRKIPIIDIEITPQDRIKLDNKIGELLHIVPISGHNLKFDINFCDYHDICDKDQVNIFNDTLIMAHQIFGKKLGFSLSLKALSRFLLDVTVDWDKPIGDFLGCFTRNEDKHYGNLPSAILLPYAGYDGYYNRELEVSLQNKLTSKQLDVTRLVTDITFPFMEAEQKGLAVNFEMKGKLEKYYTELMITTEKQIQTLPIVLVFRKLELDRMLAKYSSEHKADQPSDMEKFKEGILKLKSHAKIRQLIYDDKFYGLPVLDDYMTKGGKIGVPEPSTGKDCLSVLIKDYLNDKVLASVKNEISEYDYDKLLEAREFLTKMLDYSRLKKLTSDYLGTKLEEKIHEGTQKPNFMLTGTTSGRLSCLVGSTEITLLSGEVVKLGDLEEGYKGWVLGSRTNGNPITCKFTSLGKTKEVSTTYKVTLDNGEVVESTNCHRFMMSDGGYTRAENLTSGDRLMSSGLLFNHKVVSIEVVKHNSLVPVYDITVPETNNFLLKAGIFVHNSGIHTLDSWSDIKRLYVSRWANNGGIFVCPDFSQLELRIAGSVSGDPSLIQAYAEGIDIHQMTGSRIAGVSVADCTKEQRAIGKTVNFSILFGKTASGMAVDLGVTVKEAQSVLNSFFDGYPMLRNLFDKTKKRILSKGDVRTIMGRTIPQDGWDSTKKGVVNASVRSGCNAVIQSPASDLVLWTIRDFFQTQKANKARSIMVASVHDSVEIDTYPGELFSVLQTFKHTAEVKMLEEFDWIKTPMSCGVEIGSSWGGATEFHIENLTSSSVTLEGSNLRCDILDVIKVMERAYEVSYEVLKVSEAKARNISYMVQDTEEWKVSINVSKKAE